MSDRERAALDDETVARLLNEATNACVSRQEALSSAERRIAVVLTKLLNDHLGPSPDTAPSELRAVIEAVERLGITELPESKSATDAYFFAFEDCRARVLAILRAALRGQPETPGGTE